MRRRKIVSFLTAVFVLTVMMTGCASGTDVNPAPAEENTGVDQESQSKKEQTANQVKAEAEMQTQDETKENSDTDQGSQKKEEAGNRENEEDTEPEQIEYKDDGVTWQEFVKNMGMGWNLGNTFDSIECNWLTDEMDYEGAWLPGNTKTTKEMIMLVKEQGFQTVRIPVSWHNHVEISADEQGNTVYTINRKWLDRVREVVDYCYEEGLYVIVNIHHDDEDGKFIYPTEEHKEQSVNYITQIWTQVAEEFAEYDLHLIFGIMNEVRLAGTADEWNPDTAKSKEAQKIMNEYTQAGVNAIRAVDKGYNESRFITCPGYAGSLYSYKEIVLPTDPGGYAGRIIAEIHAYTPYSFCMDASGNGKSVYDEGVQVSVQEVFRVINEQWTSKGIPAVISEWGTILKADNAQERIKHAKYYVKLAMTACSDPDGETVQVPCILWDNGNVEDVTAGETFGYLDRQNVTWFDQEYVDAIIDTFRNPE